MRLKKRVDNLELGELQDLLNMEKMSDGIRELEKQLGDLTETISIGLDSAHEVLIGLMNYFKLEFNEEGELVKAKKK